MHPVEYPAKAGDIRECDYYRSRLVPIICQIMDPCANCSTTRAPDQRLVQQTYVRNREGFDVSEDNIDRDPKKIERSAQIFGVQLDKVDDYLAAGITHFSCDATGLDYGLAPLRKLIAWRDAQGS